MYDKKLFRFEFEIPDIRTCNICGGEAVAAYEIAETRVQARIIGKEKGFMCGECAAKLIADLKFTLERR
jgi:hypothetical protein